MAFIMRRTLSVIISTLSLLFIITAHISGQCIIANPSFEISGSAGEVFGGWNQTGSVGSASNAPHGFMAAKVTGPNLGGWDVSGYWQQFDASPGERWEASVRGWHTSTNPLTGQCSAILNIEWRDSGDNLISYESHQVATASTPVDEIQEFTVVSGQAPSGTAKARLLLGVLQSPTDPPPDVYYDLADFNKVGPPSIDDIQWNDFPGGRTIDFAGRSWRVKGPGYYGPGPNLFCDGPGCVWVDGEGQLHVTVTESGGAWYSTEVVLEEALGYGDYIFTTVGRLDQLDPNVVLGIFLWQYGPCWDPSYLWWNPYNEIDIEFSRWGDPGKGIGQFVAQPYDYPGNINRFDASFTEGELTSHAFSWHSDQIEYRSWRGGLSDEEPANMINEWTYTGPHIPRPEQPRVHINLWRLNESMVTEQEVVLRDFRFYPEGTVVADRDYTASPTCLHSAVPNPFNPVTTIGFTLDRESYTTISVYDVSGRHIRDLVSGIITKGYHEVTWNGRNSDGRLEASGVYFCRLKTANAVETRKMVLLR